METLAKKYSISDQTFHSTVLIILTISWPASTIIRHSSGKVSRLCPGMNQVVLILYLSNILSKRRTPMVPAKRPREMSEVLSSPP